MAASSVIEGRGLVQTFQTGKGKNKSEVHAVNGVDLDVAEGEVVGFRRRGVGHLLGCVRLPAGVLVGTSVFRKENA